MFDQNRTVSIVVPTYNRKVYLKECLESLLNQTYKNIEIIVSDDGSTDGTVEFMNEMVDQYENIKFVQNRKYPKGPNGNKNNGLDFVNSEVVGILDDDDTLVPHAIEVMIEKMNEGYDVVMTNCIRSDNGEFSGYGLTQNREVDPKEYLCGKIGGEFWSLFKRSLLGQKRFDVDIYGGEGLVWKELLTQAKIFYIHQGLRIYRIHPQSVMHKTFENAKEVLRGYERDIEHNKDKLLRWCPCHLAYIYTTTALFAKMGGEMKKALNFLLEANHICKKQKRIYVMFMAIFLPKSFIAFCYNIYNNLRRLR